MTYRTRRRVLARANEHTLLSALLFALCAVLAALGVGGLWIFLLLLFAVLAEQALCRLAGHDHRKPGASQYPPSSSHRLC